MSCLTQLPSVCSKQVQYEWNPDDHHFHASGDEAVNGSNVAETLNAVWELNRYTVQAAILDTYTDSNPRERRPVRQSCLLQFLAALCG